MVIQNAIVCDSSGERTVDVRIQDGIVTEIATKINDANCIDAKGTYLMPSLVDTNIRLQDSVLNAQNIQSITKEAMIGGVGHIVLNADSNPAIDNEVVLEFAQNGLRDLEGVNVSLMLNSLKEDASLSNIAIMLKKGIVAPYMSTIAKNDIAIKIAQYVQMYNVTLFCKAEDNSLISSGVMLDGDVSTQLGLAGIPDLSEVLHVSRMIEIARHFKIKILFKAIASPRSIYLINQAKKDGLTVSCEVSIHHLLKSDKECEGFNTSAKLNPPLSSTQDVQELQNALKNSQIDCLTSLHQPSSPLRKEVAFYEAAYGCESLKDILPLYFTKLVQSGIISMSKLIELCVTNPAKSIGLDKGRIEVGSSAELILFDSQIRYTVKNTQSLYHGETLQGKVITSF